RENAVAAAVRSGLGSKELKLAERRRRMVEFLLKRGAATNLPDDEPWATPLAWARKLGLAEIDRFSSSTGLQDSSMSPSGRRRRSLEREPAIVTLFWCAI